MYVWFWTAQVTIWVCWGAFLTAWLVGAIYNWFRAPAVRRRRLVASGWLVAVPAVLIIRLVPRWVWRPVTVHSPVLLVAGLLVLVIATAFAIWARVVLGQMWTVSAVIKDDHQLRTDGPYAITRNPIYTGILGMVLGTAAASGFGPTLVLIALAPAWIWLKIRAEERLLTETFPLDYAHYRQQVPRLIPRLTPVHRPAKVPGEAPLH
jgi:protein-S-isoprenylcysteine O-methyltransferase Ste14